MMLTSTGAYVDSALGSSSGPRWPYARDVACSLSWQRGRLIPTVRCVLVRPEQYWARIPGSAGPARWPSSKLWVRTKAALSQNFAALADSHRTWSSQSLQTLQKVGSMIRSTSIDCLAALGTSTSSSKRSGVSTASSSSGQQLEQAAGPSSGGSGGDNDDGDDQDEDSLVRASLGRFLTTASDAEVSQAARMSDLSNMAYDVLDVTSARLQEAHGLALVAHSRSSAAGPLQQLGEGAAAPQRQLQESVEQQQQQQHVLQQLPLPQAPWPVPMALLQPAGHRPSTDGFGSATALPPTSPRTPAVMASYAEDDFVLQGAAPAAELQPVTASGQLADAESPRRRSTAAAAAAGGGGAVAVAPVGMPAAPAMGDVPPGYLQPALMRQHSSDYAPPYGVQYPQYYADEQQLSLDEAALLQQLKQQEAFVLLEMQASQQMMMLLQQTQHLQDSGPASAQDLAQLQDLAACAASSITAAASTAAAAALAGSSAYEELAAPGSPLRSSISAGGAFDPAADAVAAAAASAADGSAAVGAPADWFCCDGPLSESDATPTRFFAIQGSITLEHWRINLTIDPCEFEAGALGPIRVHRGMYEAVLSMYDTILPLVQQHLAAHPEGNIALTGHSLGGSLATLLMLLMVHRGDLSPANVATVYTFGAPAVFCEGANGSPPTAGACQSCSLPCEHRKAHVAAAASSSSATDSLLTKLGLPADAVVNVIMTRDIVPRAFVCDYTLVAGVLKSWLPSFKEHKGLAACKSHKALYNFVGVVEVLQPSKECDFVLPDEGHDMLPPGAALYKLTELQQQPATAAGDSSPGCQSRRSSFNSLSSLTNISSRSLSSALAELTSSFSLGRRSSSSSAGQTGHDDSSSSLRMVAVPVSEAAAAAAAAPAGLGDVSPFAEVQAEAPRAAPGAAPAVARPSRSSSGGGAGGGVARKSPEGLTLGDAILTFMNSPHPLQTLGEMRAYGHNGSISRYHNPTSYTKALQKLDNATKLDFAVSRLGA